MIVFNYMVLLGLITVGISWVVSRKDYVWGWRLYLMAYTVLIFGLEMMLAFFYPCLNKYENLYIGLWLAGGLSCGLLNYWNKYFIGYGMVCMGFILAGLSLLGPGSWLFYLGIFLDGKVKKWEEK